MVPVSDLRAFLEGTWQVERTIDDLRAKQAGTFTGSASFVAEDARDLVYLETGTLMIGGHTGDANRRYRYVFSDAPETAQVLFDDGAPFHILDLTNGQWSGVHDCPPDTYEGNVTVQTASEWHSRWRVTGPRKDYVMETIYIRS